MSRSLLLAAMLAASCSSTVPTAAAGGFSAPSGLGATGAGDRDLVFIANSGRDSLRALQLCNTALQSNGSASPTDACSSSKAHGQFIPAPIRVFPANIETGTRTVRVADVRLKRADGSAAGVAFAVGADRRAALIDARSLVDVQATPGVAPKPVAYTGDLGDRTVDVVAANPTDPELDIEVPAGAGQTVTTFVATRSELLVFDVGLDANGASQVPAAPRARCTLAPVVPTKIALVPGSDAKVYVADGAGDGVVVIDTASIGGGACTMHRISAGGRSVRSVAVSPKWYETANGQSLTHGPGDLLMLVVEPQTTVTPGNDLDPGGVLFASTGLESPEGVFPIPPFDRTDTGAERMQPLSVPAGGIFQEGTFLRSIKPRGVALAPDLTPCIAAPCTPLYVSAPTTSPTQFFSLLAAATSSDGGTFFLDPVKRRLVNQSAYAQPNDASLPPIVNTPVFTAPGPNAPTILVDPASAEPGVTHNSTWRAIWHSPIPGLNARGGTLTHTAAGTLRFAATGVDFTIWQNDAAIALAAGDVVSFGALSLAGDNSAACQQVTTAETTPFRFELPIVGIGPGALELAELPDTSTAIGFHPDGCSALGAVAEVRTAGPRPWLVFDGSTVRGRVEPDGSFVARQRRFDYPRTTYDGSSSPPQASTANPKNIAFSFAIVGAGPVARSGFQWTASSSVLPVTYADSLAAGGLATALYPYSSPRSQSLVFTSVTGGNEVLQADPSLLSSNLTTGLVAYR